MAAEKTPSQAPAAPAATPETPPGATATEAPSRAYVQIGFLFAAAGAILFSTKAIAIKLPKHPPMSHEMSQSEKDRIRRYHDEAEPETTTA